MSSELHETIRRRFDERAARYDESEMHRGVADAVARFASLDRVDAVLDVATGTGLLLRALHRRLLREALPMPQLLGVDLSPGMLAVARRELPQARFETADAAALPLPEASVDLLFCVTALHVIPDQAAAIAEWRRVLRPQGRAITATFASTGSRQPNRNPYPVNHEPFASVPALESTFAELGFSLLRHRTWEDGMDAVIVAELRS